MKRRRTRAPCVRARSERAETAEGQTMTRSHLSGGSLEPPHISRAQRTRTPGVARASCFVLPCTHV
eukprot:6231587-Prymnesium_polylepis.1